MLIHIGNRLNWMKRVFWISWKKLKEYVVTELLISGMGKRNCADVSAEGGRKGKV